LDLRAFSMKDRAGAEETPTRRRVVSAVRMAASETELGLAGGRSSAGSSSSMAGAGSEPMTGAREAASSSARRRSSSAEPPPSSDEDDEEDRPIGMGAAMTLSSSSRRETLSRPRTREVR
jgi:hypothetical protein